MLGKFEYEVLAMPKEEFARWCAFLIWEEQDRKAGATRARHLSNVKTLTR